jgi:hypothetical protein
MKTKVSLSCLLAALLCTQLYAQKFINKQRHFGSANEDDGIDMRKTADGGMVACHVAYYPYVQKDYYIVKFDSMGRKQKELTLGGDGDDRSFSIVPYPRPRLPRSWYFQLGHFGR